MKLNKDCKIEKVCGNDKLDCNHPSLWQPYLKGHTLMASNGQVAVFIRVERNLTDTNGPVPIEAIKASRKKESGGYIMLNGMAEIMNGPSYPRPTDMKFPNVGNVIPRHPASFTIRLNPYLLAEVAEALGVDRREGVTLEFIKPEDVFRIDWNKENKAVMMPMTSKK